ncbi:pyridoxal phosphate-dependent aminotransferase [Conexivisphaera calida]|uniref:Aminotransferase n=1 Tax=Conexivisphaera calida TaxID=1874277 RepID=A0A4P2VD68_9ARCH|nr:histidinol-phosphate transaminase [Conexivisphaera calida]BBE42576.1 L-threonine 3-O-phosphate decarboxylase [Conexivisphaera calida]
MNVNPLPPPGELSEVLRGCLAEDIVRGYPDYEYRDLKDAIRSFYDVDGVVPLNGSSEGVLLALVATGSRRIVVVQPSYGEYHDLAEAMGVRYESVVMSANGSRFELDLDAVRSHCTDPEAIVVVTNPNNPTGSFVDPRELEGLASECRSWILLDEAYAELSDAYPGIRPPAGDRMIVLRSLTKWLSVPGLRIGFAALEGELVRRMDALRAPWNVNSVADCFVRRTLGEFRDRLRSYITTSREYISVERSRMSGRLGSIGLQPFDGSANFLLVRSPWPTDELAAYLRSRGILIREAWTFEGLDRTFFRVAVRSREDDDALLAALEGYARGAR